MEDGGILRVDWWRMEGYHEIMSKDGGIMR